MDYHDLLDKLQGSGLNVFSPSDVARLADISIRSAYVKINRMFKMKKIYKIENGKFCLSDDPFIASTQITHPSYISFSTAMYLHGKFQQVINEVFVITSKKKARLMIFNMPVIFITIKPELIFGYNKVKKGDSYIFLADFEKALVDSLYLPRYMTIGAVFDVMQAGFKKKLFEEYVLRMNSESVLRRAGYLLERLGYETRLKPNTKTTYKLNPTFKSKKTFNSKWKLYINERI